MEPWRYGDLLADGLSLGQIRDCVAAGTLTRVARGAYVAGSGAPSFVDVVRALFLVLPSYALAGFHTAAELCGFGVVPSSTPHIVVPARLPLPDIDGVASHQARLPLGDPVLVAGIPCVPPDRCAIDLARFCDRLDALAVQDAALRSGCCTMESLMREVARHDRLRGVRQARQIVPMADARSECRQESHLRLTLLDGRLPPPEPQLWVNDDQGRRRYRLDLGYTAHRVGLEYDGRSHLERAQMRRDRERHNWLAAHGWDMCHFTDIDLYRRPTYIISTVRAALARARAPLAQPTLLSPSI